MTKGYLIAHVKVNDASAFTPYQNATWRLVDKYEGKWVVRAPTGADVRENENGVAKDSATVVIEFPSFDQAKEYYDSEGYQAAKKLREPYSEATFVLVSGAE